MFDGQQLGEDIVALVRSFLEREVKPLRDENEALAARVKELEDRPPPEMPAPASLEAVWSEIRPDAEEIIAEAVSRAVEALPKPKDGENGLGATAFLIDREGHLIATLSNGETRDLGEIVGKDGKRGKDGRDGLGFDDLDVQVLDDDRTIELSFKRDGEEKAFTLKWPTVIFRGSYKHGETYEAGDCVNWGGHMWVAEKTTSAKPDQPDEGWRLAVKRGRDGKDAKSA